MADNTVYDPNHNLLTWLQQQQQLNAQREDEAQAAAAQGKTVVGSQNPQALGNTAAVSSPDSVDKSTKLAAVGGTSASPSSVPLPDPAGPAPTAGEASAALAAAGDMNFEQAARYIAFGQAHAASEANQQLTADMVAKTAANKLSIEAQQRAQNDLVKQVAAEHKSAINTAVIGSVASVAFVGVGALVGFKYQASLPLAFAGAQALSAQGAAMATAIDKNVPGLGGGYVADQAKLDGGQEKVNQAIYDQQAQAIAAVLTNAQQQAQDLRKLRAQQAQEMAQETGSALWR